MLKHIQILDDAYVDIWFKIALTKSECNKNYSKHVPCFVCQYLHVQGIWYKTESQNFKNNNINIVQRKNG